jgi:hypothetical protein
VLPARVLATGSVQRLPARSDATVRARVGTVGARWDTHTHQDARRQARPSVKGMARGGPVCVASHAAWALSHPHDLLPQLAVHFHVVKHAAPVVGLKDRPPVAWMRRCGVQIAGQQLPHLHKPPPRSTASLEYRASG